MSVLQAAAFGAVLALASRGIALLLHRRWFRTGFAGDSSAHLAIVRTLRRRPTARWIDEYVIAPESMSYPTGFHRVAALFPLSVVEAHSWLPNLVLWVVGIGAFAGYSAFAADSLLHVDSTSTVWMALAVLLVTPSSVVFRGPAIAYLKLSERLLGRLATAFAILLLVAGTAADHNPSLIAAAAVVTVAFNSSIFARQALGFGLPLLALTWWDWRPLAVLAAGAALAVATGRSRFVQGMRHTWIQWHLYARLTKASPHVGSALSHFARFGGIRRALRDPQELNRLFADREPLRALVMYPEIVVAAILLAVESRLGWHWVAPIAVFAALYLVTSTERFNHLGESYRYLEYGLFLLVPVELALLAGSWSSMERGILVGAFALWSAALVVRAIVRGSWLGSLPDRDVLSEFLRTLDLQPGDVVFPVSMHLAIDICARIEGVRSFWWQPGIVSTAIYDEFIEEYPYLKREYRPLVERYGVTHVICDKAALDQLDWSYDFSDLEPLSEDERYVAFAVPRPASTIRRPLETEAVSLMSMRTANRSERMRGVSIHPVRTLPKGRRLPGGLLVDPGNYTFSGQAFALEEPGVYRFGGPDGLAVQRLVPGGSVEELLSDASWIFGYGTTEDVLSNRRRLRLARRRRISLTCTPLSAHIADVLTASGFEARLVIAFTRDELNDDDNGHTLIEIRQADQWVLYDPSFRTFFRRNGRRLSLPEWCDAVVEADYEIEPLAAGVPSLGSFTAASVTLRDRMERLVASEELRRRWYEHIGGVPLVGEAASFLFPSDDALAERLVAYSRSYRPIQPDEFRRLWDMDASLS